MSHFLRVLKAIDLQSQQQRLEREKQFSLNLSSNIRPSYTLSDKLYMFYVDYVRCGRVKAKWRRMTSGPGDEGGIIRHIALAKVLWLLTYDVQKTPQDSASDKHMNAPLMDALDKNSVGMPPIQWLPWIPQLLTCLATSSGNSILSLLTQVSKVYPQAVFLPIRTMYFTLKIEQRERYKIAEQSGKPMVWFRENWYEEVLRQVKLGLTKCYGIAFENRDNVNDANITAHTFNFVKKLITTFGIGIENVNSMTATFASAGSESLARRAQQTIQDPVFQRMKTQFTADFDFKILT
ncbi:transformation/transcription domain-associated protein-like [Diaphorina citri]|uniref:Transformation/transcription domain-associated protein-like n=1 Tax=Diaphorina citri TaxID=121845 RepID=A0A3Q0IME3_DIACI|nr:transformation/transcription domain-associated protein-like [Diaphorina citri]